MRHVGAAHDALRSTIARAAQLTVQEGENVGPRLARWKALSGDAVRAPGHSSGVPLPDTGQPAERIQEGCAG
jgi:hypothetical protein